MFVVVVVVIDAGIGREIGGLRGGGEPVDEAGGLFSTRTGIRGFPGARGLPGPRGLPAAAAVPATDGLGVAGGTGGVARLGALARPALHGVGGSVGPALADMPGARRARRTSSGPGGPTGPVARRALARSGGVRQAAGARPADGRKTGEEGGRAPGCPARR